MRKKSLTMKGLVLVVAVLGITFTAQADPPWEEVIQEHVETLHERIEALEQQARFFDMGDGTVIDTRTRLQWLKDANCLVTHYPELDTYDDTSLEGTVVWETALEFVEGMNDGTYPDCGLGYTDWEFPTKDELQSLGITPDYADDSVRVRIFPFWEWRKPGLPFTNLMKFWGIDDSSGIPYHHPLAYFTEEGGTVNLHNGYYHMPNTGGCPTHPTCRDKVWPVRRVGGIPPY